MKKIVTIMALVLMAAGAYAHTAEEKNEARQVFDKVYDMVFGPQGSTLRYDVNIIGLYKTHGVISYKGKKQRFTDNRVDTWNDGVTAYMVYRKKKVVEIHDASSDKKDKYSGRFKFTLDDFDYSMDMKDGFRVLVLKRNSGAKGTIKEVRAYVDPTTLVPKYVKLKVAFVWTKIKISNFRSGNVSDDIFVFPRERYSSSEYEYIDKR